MLVFVGDRKGNTGRTLKACECSDGAGRKRVLTPGACACVPLRFPGVGVRVGVGIGTMHGPVEQLPRRSVFGPHLGRILFFLFYLKMN